MKKSTRVILFAVVAVMLFSFAPFCAFADDVMAADGVITAGGSATATVPAAGEYTLKFTAPEDGQYVVWSEVGDSCDPLVDLYGAEGEHLDGNDDIQNEEYYLNFKLPFWAEAGEVFYIVVSDYNDTADSKVPVFVDKLAEATGIEVLNDFHPAKTVVGLDDFVQYRVVPANAVAGPVVFESDDPDVVYTTEYGDLHYDGAGKANITLSLEDKPEVSTSVEINVTEPYIPDIALGELAPLSGDNEYRFVAPEDGNYVVYTTQPDVDYRINGGGHSGKALLTLREGENIMLMTYSSDPGMLSETCYIAVKKATDSKEFDFAFYNEYFPETETEVIYPGQDVLVKAELSDPASIRGLHVEFSVDSEDAVVSRIDNESAYINFSKPGTYTVTAVDYNNEKTVTKTVTVSEYPEVTLDTPYVHTTDKDYLTGVQTPVIFPVAFTAPEDGEYTIEVGNDMGMTSALIQMGNGFPPMEQSVISGITMQKGESVVFDVFTGVGIGMLIPESLFKTGELNVTVTAKKYVELTDVSVPESITMKAGQTKVLELVPSPAGASIDFMKVEVDTTDAIDAQVSDGKLYIEAYVAGEGDAEVTLTLRGEITKTIKVKVLPANELELGTPVGADDDVKIDTFNFTAPEDGYYTFSVKNALADGPQAIADGLGGLIETMAPNSGTFYLDEGDNFMFMFMPLGDDASFTVTKSVRATGIEVNGVITAIINERTYLDMLFATTFRFTPYNAVPEYISNITFADPTMAVYDKNRGSIIAAKLGSTTVEIETENGLKTTATLVVVDRMPASPTDIYLNKTELTLDEGDSETLTATAESVIGAEFYWSSSDESVATVDQNGKVTAVGAGTATIYANYYIIPLKCTVTVNEKAVTPLPPSSDPEPPKKPEIKDTTKIFKDVEAGKWYVNAVNYTYSYGFIAGVAADRFGVDEDVTRGQFITILARIAGVDTIGDANKVTTKFADVESGRYYTAAIKWANENGIVAGMSNTEFAPNKAIERQQLCVMIVNFAKHQGVKIEAVEAAISFADAAEIGNYAKEAVATCQKADIVNGYNEQGKILIKPARVASRVEAAQILYKFHKDFVIG